MEETKRLFASLQQQLLQQYLRRKLLLLLQTRVPQGPLCEERNSQQTKYKRHTRAAPSPGTTSQVRTAHSYATRSSSYAAHSRRALHVVFRLPFTWPSSGLHRILFCKLLFPRDEKMSVPHSHQLAVAVARRSFIPWASTSSFESRRVRG